MIQSRDALKQYALRALGAPVLEINVDDTQLEDRLDEALEYWRLYHPDGIERIYMKYPIEASALNLAVPAQFVAGKVTGQTSGAVTSTWKLKDNSPTTTVQCWMTSGAFIDGEILTDEAGTTATLTTFTQGSWDDHFIKVPDLVYGVNRVLPFYYTGYDADYLFNVNYQLRMNELWDLSSTSIIYFDQTMRHLDMLDMELNTKPTIEFNRASGKLYLEMDWQKSLQPGTMIIAECYRVLDPDLAINTWNDQWLRSYTIALFKRQWAINIKKFSGIQLPGGVTLDGIALYQEAASEIKDLESELMNRAAPLAFFMG